MRTQTKLAMLTLAVLAAFQAALAQGAQPSGPPKEMAQLTGYGGSWTCDGSVPEGPLGPAHESTTAVKIHGDLGGMWFSGRIEETASKENPHPLRGMLHMPRR